MLLIFTSLSIISILLSRGMKFRERIAEFSKGAGQRDLLFMVWIFVLAGAFASSAKAMGAVDATVNLTLQLLPANFLVAGLFISACIVSLCMGTSVGTIVALVPIATSLVLYDPTNSRTTTCRMTSLSVFIISAIDVTPFPFVIELLI